MKKNNKGFSLVELIIVIAIMAALVAILAPQYIKYVEKSRLATDKSLAEEIFSTVQTIVLDPAYTSNLTATFSVNLSAANGIAVTCTDATTKSTVEGALAEVYGTLANAKATNKTGKSFTVDATLTSGLYSVARNSNWG